MKEILKTKKEGRGVPVITPSAPSELASLGSATQEPASGRSPGTSRATAQAEYTQAELDEMRAAEDSLNDDDDEQEAAELLGYYCIGCGHSQAHLGWGCVRCGGTLDEWYA